MSRKQIALAGALFVAAVASGSVLWFVHTRQGGLSRGRAERGTLQSGSSRSWWVALRPEEHAAVAVRPEGAEISARLVDPSGEVRRTLSGDGSKPLVLQWIADRQGRWRIELDPGEGPVPYSIELTALRAATPRDHLVWEAESADERLLQALAGSGGESDRALDLLPQAVALREKLLRSDPPALATYLNDLAFKLATGCAATPERWRTSESLLLRALRLRESRGPDAAPEVAETLASLATVASFQGHWNRAGQRQERALALDRKRLPSKDVVIGDDLTGLAAVRFEQGRYAEAESLLSQALKIFQNAEPRDGYRIANVYNRLGDLRRALGSYTDAEESFEQAYRQAHESLPPEDLLFMDLANNLAGVFLDLGESHRAEPLFRDALEICEGSAECCPWRRATARLNLAGILHIQGDFENAGPLYSQALGLAMAALAEDDPELAWFLNRQGFFFREQGEHDKAVPFYEEARAVTERAFGPEHPQVAMSLHDLAGAHTDKGEFAEAEELYSRALAIRRKRLGERHPEVGQTLTRLGELCARTGRDGLAEGYLDEAIGIFAATKAFPENEAEAWEARAKLAKSRGDLPAALSSLRRSVEIIERLRPLIGGGERTRARFLSRHQDVYELMIDWEIEAGDLDRAFEYAERVRARALVDQLFAARVDLRAGIRAEVRRPLEKREAEARARHAELKKRIANLERGLESAGAEAAPELLAGLLRERDEAQSRLEEIEEEIRNASPLWKATAGAEPVRLSEARAELVEPGELLLLYQIGPESGHVLLLPPEPAEAFVEPLVVLPALASSLGVSPGPLNRDRLFRILRGQTRRNATSRPPGLLGALGEHPSRGGPRLPDFFSALHALKQVLLPGEIWEQVRKSSRVVVVPGGTLHGFPFESLVVSPRGPGGPRFWLDEGPAVQYAASVTALRKLADRSRLREPVPARKSLLLSVAAPRFAASEGKIAAPRGPGGEALSRAFSPAGDTPVLRASLSPLPGTEKEAKKISAAFRPEGGVVLLAGAKASEANVRAALGGRRYLHFATHGLVDEQRNGMFAALALTPPAEIARTEDDGFLQLFEIYGLDLRCDLAVLSACETHMGPDVAGEGVFALSRGFLIAGADRVVASLWRVDDEATAELMGDLFREIADAGRRGNRPAYAEALRQARRKIRNQARWSDPYYWAPFVLDGKGR